MLPAPSFADVLSRAPAFGTPQNPAGQRLISIVFANPTSPVWRDIHTNRAFLDNRSGNKWDLFFAGMSGFVRMDQHAKELWDPFWREEWHRYFNPNQFRDIELAVQGGHRAALPDERKSEAWTYSGGTDLVSFLCYSRDPDWLTTVCVRLDDGTERLPYGHSLGEVTEALANWEAGEVDPRFAPGEFSSGPDVTSATPLLRALMWSGNAIVGGVLGNMAFELLNQIGH